MSSVQPSSEGSGKSTNSPVVRAAIVTGIFGLLVAVVTGFFSYLGGKRVEASSNPPVPAVTVTQTVNGATGNPPPSPNPSSSTSPDIRNEGVITLAADGDAVALSSDQPDWNGVYRDMRFTNGKLEFYGGGYFIDSSLNFPSYSACATAGGYSGKPIDVDQLKVGEIFCVKISGDLYGMLRLNAVSPSKISMDAITWQKQ